jgi:hypothetical protein
MEETFHPYVALNLPVLTNVFKLFLHIHEETPEEKQIAKMLIEEYMKSEHNFPKKYFELQAAGMFCTSRCDLAGKKYG